MIQFVCDSCGRVKKPSEAWIIAMAAEAIGVTVARREVTIQSGTKRLPCIPWRFTSARLNARTPIWRNYSHLTRLRKKGLLSGQQKPWLKDAVPQCRGS